MLKCFTELQRFVPELVAQHCMFGRVLFRQVLESRVAKAIEIGENRTQELLFVVVVHSKCNAQPRNLAYDDLRFNVAVFHFGHQLDAPIDDGPQCGMLSEQLVQRMAR